MKEIISTAALLHDIGTNGESDLVKTKLLRLTPTELAEYRAPVRGQPS
jgi:HD-GYP domain-containing protein (c-di-GMP phosphodiesterase class II)